MLRLIRPLFSRSLARYQHLPPKVSQQARTFKKTCRRLTTAFAFSFGAAYLIKYSLKDQKDANQQNGQEPKRSWTVKIVPENSQKENVSEQVEAFQKGDRVLCLEVQENATKEGLEEREGKVVSDMVHGLIELPALCVDIIDTPQFQRLRYLKQMGTVEFVYPGAVHTRFEHSLGVCHLAGLLLRSLQKKQPELNITDKDVLCVQIAALCHDLGHGPFSHMFDDHFIKAVDKESKWKHEQGSVDMFDYMCEDPGNKLKEKFKDYGLDDKDIKFIKEQICGPDPRNTNKWQYEGRPQEKAFLYDIVANKRNGIDVDKWDYLSRDCLHLGMKSNFDHHRCIHFARVIMVDNTPQICLRQKEAYGIQQMYETRFALHKRACQHKVVSATNLMIVDALKKANPTMRIPKADGTKIKMSECIKKENMDAYVNLTDEVIRQILLNPEVSLAEAKQLVRDVWSRKIYKLAAESPPFKGRKFKNEERETIKDEILKAMELDAELENVFRKDDVVVQLANFDHGMKDKNPWDEIHFYSKDNPDVAKTFPPNEISLMVPHKFQEQIVRVYLKPGDNDEINKKNLVYLRRAFNIWLLEKRQKGLVF